jgi:hypothetical protein
VPVDLGELGFCGGEADFEALGFAEPAFPLGLGGDAGGLGSMTVLAQR